MDIGLVAAIVIYFVAMLGIGVYFLKRTKSGGMKEYFLGGRKMNPYVTALSAQASDMSGWLLMGLPGAIVLTGMGEAWIGIGLAIGSYLCWLFVAKRLRKHTKVSGDAITMPEFFSNRYHDKKGYLRLISTVIILFFFTIYVASGFKSCGSVLYMAFDKEIILSVAIIIGAIITVVYTMMGGYTAVCWADFTQAILMVICAVIVPIAAINALGGWGEVTSLWDSTRIENYANLFYNAGEPIGILAIVSAMAWGFGYFGMPHIVVRYMSIRHPDEVKIARRVSLIWIVVALTSVIIMALVGSVYFEQLGMTPIKNYDGSDPSFYNPEYIFMMLAESLFFPFICGIIFAAILAAIMSTVDSQLLVATSSITNDILGKSKKYNFSDNKLTWISRIAVVIISIVAVIIALYGGSNIMELVSYAWSGFGSAFGPLMILSLFWKRMNLQGAMASMIAGFIVVIIWQTFLGSGSFSIYDTGVYSLLPGFIISLIVGVIVALLTAPPSKDIEDEFDAAQVYEEPRETA